jgi:hypothetical protein
MPQWLYHRLKAETPSITPDFSLRNSSRWQRALKILCNGGAFEEDALKAFYQNVPRRGVDVSGDNLVFESVLMSLHYLASLERMVENHGTRYDHVRSSIIAWYYGIYYAASAMVAAADGSTQETHAATARCWGRQLLDNRLVVEPFSYSLSTLVKSDCAIELGGLRSVNTYDLNDRPIDIETARGGCISYLKGTADRDRGIVEIAIKSERGFRDLGVDNYRTRVAQTYRDSRLVRRNVNFLHQAFRYRGKANYRDAIFLAYGSRQQAWIDGLMEGLYDTLQKFLKMATFYCPRRVERGSWAEFKDDLESNSLVKVPGWLGD